MSEMEFGKNVDEIEEPVLVPESWQEFEIEDDPKVLPNEAFKSDPTGEKAGHNWVVHLKLKSDEPMYNGRRFTIWLGVPKDADKESYTQVGQKVYDAKMQRIVNFVEAFGGTVGTNRVSLGRGMKGMCYVLQQVDRIDQDKLVNSIDIFNAGFKKVE